MLPAQKLGLQIKTVGPESKYTCAKDRLDQELCNYRCSNRCNYKQKEAHGNGNANIGFMSDCREGGQPERKVSAEAQSVSIRQARDRDWPRDRPCDSVTLQRSTYDMSTGDAYRFHRPETAGTITTSAMSSPQ